MVRGEEGIFACYIPSNLQLCFSLNFLKFAIAGLLPKAEADLEEVASNPLRVAKIPKHMKGKYIVNSLSDAFLDPIISDSTTTCNP
jgi:hypothetical protein